jgi:hypothetical protein
MLSLSPGCLATSISEDFGCNRSLTVDQVVKICMHLPKRTARRLDTRRIERSPSTANTSNLKGVSTSKRYFMLTSILDIFYKTFSICEE